MKNYFSQAETPQVGAEAQLNEGMSVVPSYDSSMVHAEPIQGSPQSPDDTAASDEETTELKTKNSMSSEPTQTAELSQVETEVQPETEQGVVVAQAPTPQGENEEISNVVTPVPAASAIPKGIDPSKIYTSSELESKYRKLATLKINRDISDKDVEKKVASIKKSHGVISPILVVTAEACIKQGLDVVYEDVYPITADTPDLDLYDVIIDGQHRKKAVDNLNQNLKPGEQPFVLTVMYPQIPNPDIRTMLSEANTATKPWKGTDFLTAVLNSKKLEGEDSTVIGTLSTIKDYTQDQCSESAAWIYSTGKDQRQPTAARLVKAQTDVKARNGLLPSGHHTYGQKIHDSLRGKFSPAMVGSKEVAKHFIGLLDELTADGKTTLDEAANTIIAFIDSLSADNVDKIEKSKGKTLTNPDGSTHKASRYEIACGQFSTLFTEYQSETHDAQTITNGNTPGSDSMTAFYLPKGPAGEYAAQGYGLNLFRGCTGGCIYCYREHGIISKSIGGDTPVLLKKYKDEAGALTRIAHDLDNHKNELVAADGVFATFTSDPGQEATFPLFKQAFDLIIKAGVPVKMLTKFTSWVNTPEGQELLAKGASTGFLAVGFTLTGHDELETGASPNADRVAAMKSIHSMGIKTFASIEPVIDQQTSLDMVKAAAGYCDMFLVGLESGPNRHVLTDDEVSNMSHQMIDVVRSCGVGSIYFKSSILKVAKAAAVIAREGSGIVVSKSIMF